MPGTSTVRARLLDVVEKGWTIASLWEDGEVLRESNPLTGAQVRADAAVGRAPDPSMLKKGSNH